MGTDSAAMPSSGGSSRAGEPADESADPPVEGHGPRLASVVMFVQDLDSSVDFYRELLKMRVTVRSTTAALLVGTDGTQLYVRAVGPGADHPLGAIGIQYVIWTADSRDDLRRCERVLKDRSALVLASEQAADGLAEVEGRDPSGLPILVAYPGPEDTARHQIMPRVYAW
ncbi:VOC family protein [Streptomyces sp. NPDC058391]|uniref:VOC family protein n=1 Tax=Streptomyces sp. NPDC058391 TaxID=3346476 RepID=UPI003666326C